MARPNIDPEKLHRSRVTNGRDLLPDASLTTASGRRWKDIHRVFMEAVVRAAGGVDRVTEFQRLQVKYLAGLCHWAEQQTARLADGEDGVDMVTFNRAMGNIQRLIDRLGIANHAMAEAESISDDVSGAEENPLIFLPTHARVGR
jgi:hypothetical protein